MWPFSNTATGNIISELKMPDQLVKQGCRYLAAACGLKKLLTTLLNKKSAGFPADFLRRERDSNPRNLSVQRFSRPPHSTTLPSLQARQK